MNNIKSIARSRTAALSLIFAAMSLTGCGSVYRSPGAENADIGQLAVVAGEPIRTEVIGVNGKPLERAAWQRFELQAGLNELEVIPHGGTVGAIRRSQRLVFQAEPGRRYRLTSETKSESLGRFSWRAWVVDTTTNRTVSRRVQ